MGLKDSDEPPPTPNPGGYEFLSPPELGAGGPSEFQDLRVDPKSYPK